MFFVPRLRIRLHLIGVRSILLEKASWIAQGHVAEQIHFAINFIVNDIDK